MATKIEICDRAQHSYLRSLQNIYKYTELLKGKESELPNGWTVQAIAGFIERDVRMVTSVGNNLIDKFMVDLDEKIVKKTKQFGGK